MRIIAELAGGIMLLAIFAAGIMAVFKEMAKKEIKEQEQDGNDAKPNADTRH